MSYLNPDILNVSEETSTKGANEAIRRITEGDPDPIPEEVRDRARIRDEAIGPRKEQYLAIVELVLDKGWAEATPHILDTFPLPQLGGLSVTQFFNEHEESGAGEIATEAVREIPPILRMI